MPRYRVVRTVELNTSYYVDVADDVDVQQLADMNPEYDGMEIEYIYEDDVTDSYTAVIFEVKPDADPKKLFYENDGKQVYHRLTPSEWESEDYD